RFPGEPSAIIPVRLGQRRFQHFALRLGSRSLVGAEAGLYPDRRRRSRLRDSPRRREPRLLVWGPVTKCLYREVGRLRGRGNLRCRRRWLTWSSADLPTEGPASWRLPLLL